MPQIKFLLIAKKYQRSYTFSMNNYPFSILSTEKYLSNTIQNKLNR